MTKERYNRLVSSTRRLVSNLPFQEKLLKLPTWLCAFLYGLGFLWLIYHQSPFCLYLFGPACCFLLASFLRNQIGRDRPYDHFGIRPVGRYQPGKKKSMPSRHAASAAAIALALCLFCPPFFYIPAVFLCFLVCLLRIVTGQHYPSDVLCGVLLSSFLMGAMFLIQKSLGM